MIARIIRTRLERSTKSILLLGARQVGKTTLLRSLPVLRTINLADESVFLAYARDPGLLVRELRALRGKGLVAVDEVQRVPRLLNSVQTVMDEGLPHRFILTGSSARKLRRGQVNLLPGRVLLEHLDPLSIEEVGSEFDIGRATRVGCLPGVYLDREAGADLLSAYTATYLREEIRAEALTREIGDYSRFLDVAAECSGQWINYSKLASDTEIPKETIRRYFSVLEDTLVAFRIPPFQPMLSKRRVTHRDKFVIFDLGVRNAILGLHDHPTSPTEKGSLFEQLVLLQCLYYSRSHRKNWRFSSYRTDAGAEVDLIIDTGKILVAIECKSGRNVNESELRGLRSFEEVTTRRTRKYVVYQGSTRQVFSRGEIAVPVIEFFLDEIQRL